MNRSKSLITALLIAMAALCCRPALGDTPEQTGHLEALKQYEEQTSVTDFKAYQSYMATAENRWDRIYKKTWVARSMDEKLKKAVDEAVGEQIGGMGYWDRVRGLWSEETINEIVKGAVEKAQKKFAPHYEEFLADLDEPYAERLGKVVAGFAAELSAARKKAASSIPGHQALLDVTLTPAVAEIQRKYQMPKLDAPLRLSNATGIAAGTGLLVLRSMLRKKVLGAMVKRLLGAVGKKVVLVIEGPIGWIVGVGLVAHDIYSVGKEIKDIPDQFKSRIYESMRNLLYMEAPRTVWNEALKEQVKQQLTDVTGLISGRFDAAVRELIACSTYKDAASKLSEQDQNELLLKLYALHNRTKTGLCRLAGTLAPILPRVSSNELNCVPRAIDSLGLETAARWMELAPQKICDLMEIPADRLITYEPNKENLAALVWISGLPPEDRPLALALERETTGFIRALDRSVQLRILKNGAKGQVEAEVARLRAPPKVIDRGPTPPAGDSPGSLGETVKGVLGWIVPPDQARIAYNLLVWTFYLLIILILVKILAGLGVFRGLAWLLSRKKE